jgi:Transcriptional regulator PadR-like family
MMGWLADIRQSREQTARRRVNDLLHLPGVELSAYAIHTITGLSSARLYPALDWLEHNGNIVSRWEDTERPGRRLYRTACNAD